MRGETLIDKIELLMPGNIQDITEISCIEPDFVFILHPEKNKDCENIYMELNVNFWNEGMMTENHLTVILGKYEIQILLTYLKYVTGKLKIADSEIIDLIKKDFLID